MVAGIVASAGVAALIALYNLALHGALRRAALGRRWRPREVLVAVRLSGRW